MTEDEIKEIVQGILTSPSFIHALLTCYEQMSPEGESLESLAAWFFSQGYLACLEFQEQKGRFKSFSYAEMRKSASDSKV